MRDYALLRAEWGTLLERRDALRESLAFWTPILDGWASWERGGLPALSWSPAECRGRWERGLPLLVEAPPDIPRDAIEDLLGPLIERLAAAGPAETAALARFAQAWDAGQLGPADLLPVSGKDGPTTLEEQYGVTAHHRAFLAHAGLRPALDAHFEAVRALPEHVWTAGICPWCGGLASYIDILEDGRRRLSCHLCGGEWMARRPSCPFCESGRPEDLVRLPGDEMEEGDFIEACHACHGYLKGVDRRRRRNAGSPLVEDWGAPHLDVHAVRQGYWRATPSLAQFLP